MSTRHSAGYLYIASNTLMPGLIKAGRTQTSVDDRLRGLYSTGVPCPFVVERARFFVDCFIAEKRFLTELSVIGKRCANREFFLVDKEAASNLLDEIYRKQSRIYDQGDEDLDRFEAHTDECFRALHSMDHAELAEQTVRLLKILPAGRREVLKLSMLAYVMAKRDERFAWWMITRCGTDPEAPIESHNFAVPLQSYYLTAYEYAIYSKLKWLESHLSNIGCRVDGSATLCYVIDTLINGNNNDPAKDRLVDFGISLLEQGANPALILNVGCFADAPISSSDFRFNLFPRNSNLSCSEVIITLAEHNDCFAKFHRYLESREKS
jgi:hypothetical protein